MAPEDGRNDESAVDYRVREAVAAFDDHEDLVAAIEELEVAGFDRAQINLMTSRAAAEKKLGHAVKDIRELEDEPKVPLGGWIDRHELAEGRTALAVGLAYIGSFAAILWAVFQCRSSPRCLTWFSMAFMNTSSAFGTSTSVVIRH